MFIHLSLSLYIYIYIYMLGGQSVIMYNGELTNLTESETNKHTAKNRPP